MYHTNISIMIQLFGHSLGNLLIKYFNVIIDYQKINKIISRCVTNTDLFILLLNHVNKLTGNKYNISAIPVIALEKIKDNKTTIKNYIHVVIKINDNIIIDPSYETYLKVSYYEKISETKNIVSSNMSKSDIIKHFLEFKEITDKMNDGYSIIPDQTYYDNLKNYINTNNDKY